MTVSSGFPYGGSKFKQIEIQIQLKINISSKNANFIEINIICLELANFVLTTFFTFWIFFGKKITIENSRCTKNLKTKFKNWTLQTTLFAYFCILNEKVVKSINNTYGLVVVDDIVWKVELRKNSVSLNLTIEGKEKKQIIKKNRF